MLPMFRALPALAFALLPAIAWAQQQPAPPPDTKPARDRHRLQEKEPPPPEGYWGPEEVGLTWNPPRWRGLTGSVGYYTGTSMETNVPEALAARSDGINPPVFESLTYHSQNFNTVSGTVEADLDVFRLSFSFFDGTFDAHATLTLDDGVSPPQSSDLRVHGDTYGFRVGAYWPAFRYRDSYMEFSVGPAVTVGWMHEVTHVPGTMLTSDVVDALTGSFGPRMSFRMFPTGRWALQLDAEYVFTGGAVRGWTRGFSFGLGYAF